MMSKSQFKTFVKNLFLEPDSPMQKAGGSLKKGTILRFCSPGQSVTIQRAEDRLQIVRAEGVKPDWEFQFNEDDDLYGLAEANNREAIGPALLSLWSEGRLKAVPSGDFNSILDQGIAPFLLSLGVLNLPAGFSESTMSSSLKDIAFTEILDVHYMQSLIDSISETIGFKIWITDMNCFPVAVSSKGGEYCKLIAGSFTGGIRCYYSAVDSLVQLKETMTLQVRKCHAGFWCFDVPLTLNGEMVGMITGDACLDENFSPDEYATLAKELDIDVDELMSSLAGIGSYNENQLQIFLSGAYAIGKVVSEMSIKQYMLSEKVKELTGLHEVSSLVTRPLPENLDEVYQKIADKVGSLKKGGYCRLSIKRDGCLKVFEGGTKDFPEHLERQQWTKDIRIGRKKMGSIELAMPQVVDPENALLDDHFFASLTSQLSLSMQNSDLFGELREKNEELRLLLRAITQVQEKERASLARDLHDDTGQNLTNALLHLDLVLKDDRLTDRHRHQLDFAAEAISTVIEQLRDLSVRLHPLLLDDLGLIEALADFLQRMNSEHGIQFSMDVYGQEKPISSEAKINIYRIVQEALSNVVQHAEADEATLYLEYEQDGMSIIIADNGKGRRKPQGERRLHLGLASMRERCEQIGGTFNFLSNTTGTLVTLQLPHTVYVDVNDGD